MGLLVKRIGLLLLVPALLHGQGALLAGQLPTLPSGVASTIGQWLASEPELVRALVVQDGKPSDFRQIHRCNNDLLAQHGIANLSRNNYVFSCPTAPDYILKISGPSNRLVNAIVENGMWPTTISNAELLGLRRTVTYQTMSSLPVYLSYERLIGHTRLKYVCLPRTYILKVPGADAVFADTNYIIVQEKIALADIQTEQRVIHELSDDQLREVMLVIAACGLWDINGKLKIAQDGRIVIVDLEQPNVTRVTRGGISHGRFIAHCRAGLQVLIDLYFDNQQRVAAIKEYAQSIG